MKKIYMLCLVILTFICGIAKADELLTYAAQDRIGLLKKSDLDAFNITRDRTSTKAVYLIELNDLVLRQKQFTFTAPDGTKYEFAGKRTQASLESGFAWYGELADKSGSIRFTSDGFHLGGVVHLPSGQVFTIRSPSQRVHFLVEVRQVKHGDDTPSSVGDRDTTLNYGPKTLATTQATTPIIRVMTVWTSSAWQADLGQDQARVDTQTMINQMNTGFANSGVSLQVVNAGVMFVAATPYYADTISVDLDAMIADNAIRLQRDAFQADIVMMVAVPVSSSGSTEGSTVVGLAKQIYATPQTAFAIMHVDTVTVDETFQHEIGHLIGGLHQTTGGYCCNSNTNFPKPDGHGLVYGYVANSASQSCFRTIMAMDSGDSRCSSAQVSPTYWSNPDIYVGFAFGNAGTNDEHRMLNELGPAVASFHLTTLGTPPPSNYPSPWASAVSQTIIGFLLGDDNP